MLPKMAVAARSHAAMLCIVTVVACFLFAGVLSSRPLLTHEGAETYRRVHEYQQELRNGNWLPQIFPDAVRGAGSAFPSFYPPFAYIVAASLAFLFGDIVWGVNIALLLAVILSGWAMYWCVLVINADRRVALASALLYISFPYRFVDVFVRGAFAESWSFVWMPLVVAGAWATFTRRRLVWYLPVAWAGLLLTHTVLSLYFLLVFGLVALLALRWSGWRTATLLAVGLALGAGLSAWYLLPQQHLLPAVRAHDPHLLAADRAFVESQRVSPRHLTGRWNNGWRGPDATYTYTDGTGSCPHYYCGLTFEVGTGSYLMITLLVAWYSSLVLARVRRRRAPPGHPLVTWLVSVAVVAYVLYLAFVLHPGFFLRPLPKAFGYIQYPWRLMGPIALLAALVVGVLAATRFFPRWVRYSVVATCALVAVTVPRFQREAAYLQTDESGIVASIAANGDRGFTVQGEYLPNGIDPYDVGPHLISAPEVRGAGHVLQWERKHGDVYATVRVDAPSTVVFPVLYYDFYRVGGAARTINVQGLLGARVAPGEHTLRVSHGPTAVNLVGFAISFLSAALLVLLARSRRFRSYAATPVTRHADNRRVEDPSPLPS
jgi:hypothetical protein